MAIDTDMDTDMDMDMDKYIYRFISYCSYKYIYTIFQRLKIDPRNL